jgi:hypothetical protein
MRQGGGQIEPGNDEGRLHLIPEGEHQEDHRTIRLACVDEIATAQIALLSC